MDTEKTVKTDKPKWSNVITQLLGTEETKVIPLTQRPILSKKRHYEKDIDEAKIEQRAKKILSQERKSKAEIGKVIPSHETTDYEKRLRKVATKGGTIH